MMKEETPRANRFHIGLFGRRNSGKSSLVNMLTYSLPKDHEDSWVPSARALSSSDTMLSACVVSWVSMCRVYSGSSSWVDRNQNSPSRNRQMKHRNHISWPRMPRER